MLAIRHWVKICTARILVNGIKQDVEDEGAKMLVSAYKRYVGDYPKFFKMDTLCRLGFIASELLLKDVRQRLVNGEECAVVLFNLSGSLCNDLHYENTISDKNNYYPSPSVFVYTLPNIVTGEICIRNKFYGESSFYVLDNMDERAIADIVTDAFHDMHTKYVVCGWVEAAGDDDYSALLMLVGETDEVEGIEFNEDNIKKLK